MRHRTKDGIALYYNHTIPARQQVQAAVNAVEKVENCIDECIQTIINDTLASQQVLNKIAGKSINEQAHQTLNLKNRFHKQLGLIHTSSFDPYAGYIEDALIDCAEVIDPASNKEQHAKKTLEIILSHMLPQEVIKQIKKGIANAVENKAITKDNLTEYLEQSGISPANDTKTTEEWLRHLEYAKDVDGEIDYGKFQGVTDKAALDILTKMGYIICQN